MDRHSIKVTLENPYILIIQPIYFKITIRTCIFCIFITSLIAMQTKGFSSPPSIQRINLAIGETKVIHTPPGEGISVSKKGIALIQNISSGKWKLIGHRKGFVVIETSTGLGISYFVNVYTPNHKRNTFIEKNQKISALCDLYKCIFQNGSLSGSIDNYKYYFTLRKICEEESQCQFKATLSNQAIKKFRSELETHLGLYHKIHINEEGYTLIEIICSPKDQQEQIKNVNTIAKFIAPQGTITPVCKHKDFINNYTLTAKAIILTSSKGNELGFSNDKSILPINKHIFASDGFLTAHALAQSKYAIIIGEPSIVLLENEESTTKSGGEFLTSGLTTKEGQSHYDWKQYGIHLKAKVQNLNDSNILLIYKFSLSAPSHKATNHTLQLSEISGTVKLIEKKSTIVGGVSLFSDNQLTSFTPVFSSIPIIGPFFKLFTKENSLSKLYLLFNISKNADLNKPK
ncbi:MAG: hypothetical protein R3B45_07425 [Bdellovibrionota bacterium]